MQLQFSQVGPVVELEGLEFAMLASQAIQLPKGLLGFFLVPKAKESGSRFDLTDLGSDDISYALFVTWDGEETCGKNDIVFIPVGVSNRTVVWDPSQLEITVTDGVVSKVGYVDFAHLEEYIAFSSQP